MFETRGATVAARTGVGIGAVSFAIMHLTQSDVVDPVATPVSSYALTWPGVVLFPLGVLSMALACAVLAVRGVGLPREGFIRFLLGATVVMLVGAALFRTGSPMTALTVEAQIHRYTAGAAFVLLTLVGGLATARMGQARMSPAARSGMLWATAASALTFLTTTVNTFLPWLADGGDWRGIPQRILLVTLSGLILALIAGSADRTMPVPVRSLAGMRPDIAPRADAAPEPVLVASKS